jgi:hypothetical protein
MPTSALRSPPTCRSTSATREVPGSAAATKTPTAWSASTSQEEPTSRASPRRISMRLPYDSINVHERPWASKPQRINYKRCCTDRLNSHSEIGHRRRKKVSPLRAMSRHPRRLTRSTILKNELRRVERLRPRGSGAALQSSFRQAGLAQGVEVPLLSGCSSSRADFSCAAYGESRDHLDVFSGGLSRLGVSTRQP